MHDIIIIGAGPSGLTAAIYARRAGKSVLVIEKNTFGGQITWAPKVENFPTIASVSGMEFADRLVDQVMNLGADLELDEVTKIEKNGDIFKVDTIFGGTYEAKAVIVAVGASPRKLGLENEEKFIGSGISFCAVCDSEFFKGKPVAVNGGGNTALQEAIYLSDTCEKVYIIHRREEFRADAALVDVIRKKPNIELVLNCTVTKLIGEKKLSSIVVTDKNGIETEIKIDCLFEAIGHDPENKPFEAFLKLDESGYADSEENCLTKTEGMFVAGDCRKKNVRQLTTAVSDGATAALAACSYIDMF